MISKIKTFFGLPGSHKWLFVKIALLVPLVELGIKTVKFKRTVKVLNFFINKTPKTPENQLRTVRRHANYLYLYQKQFPFLGKCLARSLSLWFLLSRKGIETNLRFGMKKEDEKLLAHSWLEYKGEAIIKESEIGENYIPFAESILPEIL